MSAEVKTRVRLTMALVTVLALVLAACGGEGEDVAEEPEGAVEETEEPTEEEEEEEPPAPAGEEAISAEEMGDVGAGHVEVPAEMVQAAEEDASAAAGGEQLEGSVTVEGHNGGFEAEVLASLFIPFTNATGVPVEYVPGADLGARVETQVRAGDPPDVVQDSAAGNMRRYAGQGQLLQLDTFLDMDVIEDSFSPSVLAAVMVDDGMYGVQSAHHAQMIWYNPNSYEGPLPPADYDELVAYAEEVVDGGEKAFCMGLEGGPNTGFPNAYLIENIFVKTYGGDMLTQWATGDLPFTSPEVRDAFEQFGRIGTSDDMVFPSIDAALTTNVSQGMAPLYADPPQCTYFSWGQYTESILLSQRPELESETDYDFFPLPAPNPEFSAHEQASGWTVFAFNDRPEVRAFMEYWSSPGFQTLLAATGRGIAANNNVPIDAYPTAITQKAAQMFQDADDVAFGPFYQASTELRAAYLEALQNYMRDPSTLEAGLENAQAVAEGES